MAGFLDPKERVVDLVLTDTGKQLLLKGMLRFAYWIPFDDEVNYQPDVSLWNKDDLLMLGEDVYAEALVAASQTLTEDPIIREATMGYRGMSNAETDTVNVFRPLYTAIPGIGHMSPLPQATISSTGSIDVVVTQKKIVKSQTKKDSSGNVLATFVTEDGYQRLADTGAYLDVSYSTSSFTADKNLEGFLITVYNNVSGTLHEVVHNRNSDGDVAYRNDLMIDVSHG